MKNRQQSNRDKKKQAVLYANGSFDNKGCEAIIRGAHEVLKGAGVVVAMGTNAVGKDEAVAKELNIQPIPIPRSRESFLGMISELLRRAKMRKLSVAIPFVKMKRLGAMYDYSFSMGGDNYCYDGQARYYRMNKNIRNPKHKNYFWGCSLEEKYYDDMMKEDLNGYDAIFAREIKTYRMLVNKGHTNVIKCTDPAFAMGKEECAFDNEQHKKKYIGFNISPLTLSCSPDPEKMFKVIVRVIEQVLEQTEYDVLLIPHVYGPTSDYFVHCRIAAAIQSKRIKVIEESYNAPQLKYIISCCDAFIGARTHATIAAYSTYVPTLVLGYSVKSLGIAEDLFGTSDGYVLKVQNGFSHEIFADHVMGLIAEKDKIKGHLQNVMDEYIKNAYIVSEVFRDGKIIG